MKYASLFVLGAGVMWGAIGIFVNDLTACGFTPIQLVAIRAVVSAVVLAALLLRQPGMFRVKWRHLWMFFGTGVCSFLMFNFAYFNAIQLSGLTVAAVLLYTSPIYVTLLAALLFGERLTGRKILAMALAVLGAALVSGVAGGGSITLPGLGFGLLAGFGYALYSIFGRFALRHYHPLTVTFYTFVFASIGALPFMDFSATFALFQGEALWKLGLMALFSGALPYILYTLGLQRMEASRAAIIACIEPVVAALLGVTLYQEPVTVFRIAGFVLVLLAVMGVNRPATTK